MALPLNINQLLNGSVVEWERLDFKQGWNPEDVMHSMCAFANDIHNWGGGYIVIGVAEQDGRPILPPKGIDPASIDSIQKQMVQLGELVQPAVNYIVEPIVYDGRHILIIWVPGGDVRPYKAPTGLGKDSLKQGRRYYVRKGSVTCIADTEDERRLIALTNRVPFDDRICHEASLNDLSKLLIEDFLRTIGSSLTEEEIINMSMEQLAWNMQIIGGSSEYLRPKNVGLLFFCKDPERFIPGARIEIVRFGENPSDVFEEKILHGPIHKQLEEALNYLKSQVIIEKVQKIPGQAKALRAYNYPYEALEEVVSNAVYHKSWDDRNPIEINIYPDRITVYNIEGPVPPISNADLQKEHVICRNYRNRRVGDFLKELDLTEGRNTGFPKIYREMRKNGNPDPMFETDERNLHFMATLLVNPLFEPKDVTKNVTKDVTKNVTKKVTENVTKKATKQMADRHHKIVDLISENPYITIAQLARLCNVTLMTINRDVEKLSEELLHIGPKRGGHWEILRKK